MGKVSTRGGKVIGERIKRARLLKGMSMQKLADKAAPISKQAIHKYEHGQATPGSDVLIRIANALDVKTEYFFRPIKLKLGKLEFRKKSRLKQSEKKSLEEKTKDHLERYLLLEDVFTQKEGSNFNKTAFTVNSTNEAEDAAENLRKKWEIGLDPIENMTELLEEKGIKVVEVDASDKFDGLSGYINNYHPFIVIGSKWPGERQRFTLAHELAHLILKISPDCEQKHREKCCHRFAAAFLVPKKMVFIELGHKRSSIEDLEWLILKEKYGLSISAWIYRARDLEIISKSYFVNLFKHLGAQGLRKKEPGELPSEKPFRFKKLLLHALAEGMISEAKAGDLLGVKAVEVRKVIKKWKSKLKGA